MNSALNYINQLKEEAVLSPFGWQLKNVEAYSDEYGNKKFKKTMEILNAENILKEESDNSLREYIEGAKKGSFNELISLLANSLKEDIRDCTKGKYEELLSNTHLVLIPLSRVSAFCFNKDEFNDPLDGNIICINQGLYFCLSMISKSVIIENADGELKKYNRSGAHEYNCAIKMFLKPNKDDLNEIFFENIPAEVYGELSAHQSKIGMLILQFIALHEFGHIVNGDLGGQEMYSVHLNSIMSNGVIPNARIDKYWEMEFEADKFALKSLCERSKNALSAWANFVTIYIFFKWLDDIEKVSNRVLCPYHPPPLERFKRLEKLMILWYGVNEDAITTNEKIGNQTNTWILHSDKYVKFDS